MKELEPTTMTLPKGKRFCTICGEVKKESNFQSEEPHCTKCCEKMLHTKVHWSGILALIATLLCVCGAVFVGIRTIPANVSLIRAMVCAHQNEYGQAADLFEAAQEAVLTSNKSFYSVQELSDMEKDNIDPDPVFTIGLRGWETYAEIYANHVAAYDTAPMLQSNLRKAVYQKSKTYKKYAEIFEAYQKAENVAIQFDQTDGENKNVLKEMFASLDALVEKENSDMIRGYAAYIKANAEYYFNDDLDQTLVLFREAMQYIPFEKSMIANAALPYLMEKKNFEGTKEFCEILLSRDSGDVSTYANLAESYFTAGKKDEAIKTLERMNAHSPGNPMYYKMQSRFAIRSDDAQKANAFCVEGEQVNGQKMEQVFSELLRKRSIDRKDEEFMLSYVDFMANQVVVLLLSGELDGAYNAVYNGAFNYIYYYSSITENTPVVASKILHLVYICGTLSGNDDASEVLSQLGYEPTDVIKQVAEGKMNLHDAFIEGKAGIV